MDSRFPFDLAGLRAALQARLPALRPSDAAVVQLALAEPMFVLSARTAEVAERAGVSPATVVRASRAVGFDGFSEFKMAIARASGGAGVFMPPPRLSEAADLAQITETVLTSHAASVGAIRGTLDADALRRAVDLLDRAGRVLVAGSGTSAAVAVDAAFRFTSIGLMVQAPTDHVSALVVARLLTAADALVVVSHTGVTPQTLRIADAARSAGATVVAVTSFTDSPLARTADVALVAGGEDLGLQMAASSSRLAHLTVVDMLHAGVALADMARTRRAEDLGIDLPAGDE
ncbi:MAG TPA: MurR/RpiR family transcriptional regulator [Actinocatenispora sp.]